LYTAVIEGAAYDCHSYKFVVVEVEENDFHEQITANSDSAVGAGTSVVGAGCGRRELAVSPCLF
jgi:hypothetical protein